MDITRFLQEGAKFMAHDRPDIWNKETAFNSLTDMYSHLAGQDGDGQIDTGGFSLQKFDNTDDGIIEYHLHRKVLEFVYFEDENETLLTDWTDCSTMINIGLDIPKATFDEDLDTNPDD